MISRESFTVTRSSTLILLLACQWC